MLLQSYYTHGGCHTVFSEIRCIEIDNEVVYKYISVADPGGTNPCQHTILPNFPKNCMKLKNLDPQGARVPRAPLDPPLHLILGGNLYEPFKEKYHFLLLLRFTIRLHKELHYSDIFSEIHNWNL